MTQSATPSNQSRPTAIRRPELSAWVRLNLTHGIGPATALTLLRAFGAPDQILAASHAAVARVIGAALATRLLSPDDEIDHDVEQTLQWAEHPDHHLLTLSDPAYPAPLLEISDPPPLLYINGSLAAFSLPCFGIVGSRHASRGGSDNAHAVSGALASQGLVIVSGLARGIDTAAHQGALATNGTTVAIMGTGIDRIYPAVNKRLAEQIVANGGALISEMPIGCAAMRGNFPRRNRLIAGMSAGILVVEAARQSGSLITARQASEFGREVFAIPGSIHSPVARGCHQLIRQGATLVESVDDILGELHPGLLTTPNPVSQPAQQTQQTDAPTTVSDGQRMLLERIGWDAVSIDALLSDTATPPDAALLAQQLLELELNGHIERLTDGRVKRLGTT